MVYELRVNIRGKSLSLEGDTTILSLGEKFYGAFASKNPDTEFLVLAYAQPLGDQFCEGSQNVLEFIRQSGLETKVNVNANDFFDPRDCSRGTGVILSTQSDQVRFVVSSD